ncbi:hypothetical protein BaRGS_00016045, partial [Batillaria attramentaria]
MMGGRDRDSEGDRPYACPVPGCKKRYKNVNGIKYHARHGHKKESKVKKTYRCFCGKFYKSVQGLRNHTTQQHPTAELPATPVTLTHNLLSPLATMSPPTLISAKEVPSPGADNLTVTAPPGFSSRLASISSGTSIPQNKIAPQVKAITMAASKGPSRTPAALAVPIGTPVRFFSQPSSVVPVPMALKSVKLDNTTAV